MKLGLSTIYFRHCRLSSLIIGDIAKSRFNNIELWCMVDHFDLFNDFYVNEMIELFTKNNINVHSIHAPLYMRNNGNITGVSISSSDPVTRSLSIKNVERACNVAKLINSLVIVLHTGLGMIKENKTTLSNLKVSIKELLERIPKGLKIAIENEITDSTMVDNIVTIVKNINNKRVGICLDVGHANITSELKKGLDLGELLFSVHLSDNNGQDDGHLLPYEGNIDWKMVEKRLKGLDIPVNLEIGDNTNGRYESIEFKERFKEICQIVEKLEFE